MNKIKVVAEIGCNHNGNVGMAKEMILAAFNAGADAVKFQTFKSENLVSGYAPKADYQKKENSQESQLEMLKRLELSQSDYLELKAYADLLGIDIFSTPFDMDSFSFLEGIGQRIWKVPSGEITNLPFLERVRDVVCDNKEIILSTGMSTLDEIRAAVDVLTAGDKSSLTVLHCNTEYPTLDVDMNLKAINVLRMMFPNVCIGLSDHSSDTAAAVVAAGMGITFIEKHFTLDRNLPGPDHKASITPIELQELCNMIRRAEVLLGEERKFVTESERKNKFIARKSIVAKTTIKKGDKFSVDNITCKRPGNGISPMRWHDVIGQTSEMDFGYDELIVCNDIPWEETL